MIAAANLGFPRMGRDRELKWALERHWRGVLDADGLLAVARDLRARHWRLQADRGFSRLPSGDFSLYDHVLDTAVTLGAVPQRFGVPFDLATGGDDALARYFQMARGGPGVPALELTKWFDTNYHYLVPELSVDQRFAYASTVGRSQLQEAAELGITTRPVIVGPVTFLRLAKRADDGPTIELLDAVLPAYEEWLADLVAHGAIALQIDEPALVLDLSVEERAAYEAAFDRFRGAAGDAELTVATYFGELGPNVDLATRLPIDMLHIDLVRAPDQLADVVRAAPPALGLSLGVVDGRNIWRTDLATLAQRLAVTAAQLGADRLQLAPSCSLLHLPVDTAARRAATTSCCRGWRSRCSGSTRCRCSLVRSTVTRRRITVSPRVRRRSSHAPRLHECTGPRCRRG